MESETKEHVMEKLVWKDPMLFGVIEPDKLYMVRRIGGATDPWSSKGNLIATKLGTQVLMIEIAGPIEIEEPEQFEQLYPTSLSEAYILNKQLQSKVAELERCLKQSQDAFEAKQKLVDQYQLRIKGLDQMNDSQAKTIKKYQSLRDTIQGLDWSQF